VTISLKTEALRVSLHQKLYGTSGRFKAPWLNEPVHEDQIAHKALAEVEAVFARDGTHSPSPDQLEGIWEISKTIQAMAAGVIPTQDFYLSSLACGMGKTVGLLESFKAMMSFPQYDNVGAIIFLFRLEEIKAIRDYLGPEYANRFSAICSDDHYNAMGNPNKQEAQLLLTTQRALEVRTREHKTFAGVLDFHYRGNPRSVRAWDEAISPAIVLTLERRTALTLMKCLERFSRKLADELDSFLSGLLNVEDTQLLKFPNVEHYGSREKALGYFRSDEQRQCIETIWDLSGHMVRAHRDIRGIATLRYEDVLPKDLGPTLVLDASGAQKPTYQLWTQGRGNLVQLYSPPKSFEGLHIWHWDTGAGKDCHSLAKKDKRYLHLAEGMASGLNKLKNERCLVVHFKPNEHQADMEAEICPLVVNPTVGDKDRVEYLTWGKHTATNAYNKIKHVFLCGVLQQSSAQNEGAGLAAMGAPIDQKLSDEEIFRIRMGEAKHNILQAACRGSVRYAIGDQCHEGCSLHIAFSTHPQTGIPREILEEIFPGHTYHEWQHYRLNEHQQSVGDVIKAQGPGDVSKSDLAKLARIKTVNHLTKLLRHRSVVGWLKQQGLRTGLTRLCTNRRGRPEELVRISRISVE
jgi:hypothetical protein